MTASSDWSVRGPERGREIHETAPVGQHDKRFPRRTPAGNRKRRRHDDRQTKPDADAGPAPDATDDDRTDPAPNPGAESGGDDDHVIDTLA